MNRINRNAIGIDLATKVCRYGLGNLPTFYETANQCAEILERNIPGDFCELGVYAGAHPAIMAHALQHWPDCDEAAGRIVHLFDSFEGIPHAGPNDDATITGCGNIGKCPQDGALKTTGEAACSLGRVKANMREWGINPSVLRYHVGWFQDTVPFAAQTIESIALLRIDGDLYDSVKVCLEHLEPLVSPGGYIVLDDYTLTGARKAIDEYRAAKGIAATPIFIEGSGGTYYWIKDEPATNSNNQ